MTSWYAFRARALWLLGMGLVLAGLAALLYFVGLVFWQLHAPGSAVLGAAVAVVDQSVASLLPQSAPAWLKSLHIGIALVLLGIGAAALGRFVARRQRAALELEERHRQDRLRRVQMYRESTRLEPFIGSQTPYSHDDEPRERRIAGRSSR